MSGHDNNEHYQETLEDVNTAKYSDESAYIAAQRRASQPKKTPFLWRFFKGLIVTALLFTFISSMGLLLLYNHLAGQTVHVKSLIPYIERIINTQLNDVHIKLKSVILKREKSRPGIQIRLLGMQILRSDGDLVAEAPEAGFNFDIQALLRGEAAAEEIIFYAPQLALLYDEAGGMKLSFAPKGTAQKTENKAKGVDLTEFRGGIGQGNGIADDQAIIKKLALIFTNLHKYRKTTSSLKKLRISDAQLYFSQGGINSAWLIPSFTVDLTQRSDERDINGSFTVLTDKAPMTVDFKVQQNKTEDSLQLNISNFMPSYIFPKIGYSGTIGLLHVPVSAVVTIRLSKTGTLNRIDSIIKLTEGEMFFPGEQLKALKVHDSTIRVSYSNDAKERIKIEPSVLRWDGNEAVLRGEFSPVVKENGWEKGHFLLMADNIRVDAKLFDLPPSNIGQWIAKGQFDLKQHHIKLEDFLYRFEGAEIQMSGDVFRTNKVPDIQLKGNLHGVSLDLLKRVWNNNVAPETLEWLGNNLVTANITKGQFKIDIPHTAYDYLNKHKVMPEKSLDLRLVVQDILGRYMAELPPIFSSETHVHLTGQYFSLYAKNIKTHLESAEELKISNFKFQIDQNQMDSDLQYGLYEFDIDARNAALLEYLSLPALGVLNNEKYKSNSFKGKAKGHFKFKIPFKEKLSAQDIAVKGKLHLKNIALKNIFGDLDLTKGDVKLSVTPEAIEAKGKIYINKVAADLTWQHIFNATPDKQPPLRIITTLTKKRQKRLGITTGKILTGYFPVELTLERMDLKNPIVKVHADITNAQFNLPSLFWTKLPGKPAQVQFEVVHSKNKKLHLKNVTLFGDDLNIEGDIYLDRKKMLESFNFKRFTLNLLTNLKVSGKMRRSDNVLMVEAEGSSFDARPFFRTLFSHKKKKRGKHLRQAKNGKKKRKKKKSFYGVDIHAKLKTLIGYHEETASNVVIKMKKRGARLLSLISRGTLKGKAPISINLVVGKNNERYLVSETMNTGAALKLIGFYSKMVGGQGSLQVNLDAPGEADQSGNLWLKNFAIIDDDIVQKVLRNKSNRMVSAHERKQDRRLRRIKTSLQFDKLKAQFSLGAGQMLLHEAYVNGPLLGATLRGKVNFRAKHIALGGTYVPLFGLNNSLKQIPLLGDIVVGRNGEGIFGITYAIQGNMKNPTVLVNPLSLITPGIFRQIMEFQSPNMQTLSSEKPRRRKVKGRKRTGQNF